MDVKEAIRKRRSVRSYSDRKIKEGTIEKIMEAVRLAPSASNTQDWHFVLVSDDDLKKKIVKEGECQNFVSEAAVIIAGITEAPDKLMKCEIPYGVVDLSIAMDHITLAATEKGIGTCWIGSFNQDKIKDLLEIPNGNKVVSLMTMGYPSKPLKEGNKDRKPLESIYSWEKYGQG